jgi:hypothetical protein
LACFLYCVSLISSSSAPQFSGVAEQPVLAQDSGELRVYWSAVANPETLLEGATRKAAEAKFRQVLREIVGVETVLSFPFPALVETVEGIDSVLERERGSFTEALSRLADLVQYELSASWAEEDQVDLAAPVKGAEYVKRRQRAEVRVSAIDNKLRAVTAGVVRDWHMRQERRSRIWTALLQHSDRERFVAALRSAGPSEGVRLRLSGPWPPDEFV